MCLGKKAKEYKELGVNKSFSGVDIKKYNEVVTDIMWMINNGFLKKDTDIAKVTISLYYIIEYIDLLEDAGIVYEEK